MGGVRTARSLEASSGNSTIKGGIEGHSGSGHSAKAIATVALLSASYLALNLATPIAARAQTTPGANPLPPVQVDEPNRAPRKQAAPRKKGGATTRTTRRNPRPVQQPPEQVAQSNIAANTQDGRTGTVGVYANSTSVATKTNTPLVNIPQSINVVTKQFIEDNAFQGLTDVTRYVPGVAIHQGEGNRDELVIRGVDSSANFFVNGFRDDVQYYRDLYNTQSIEVLKGPSALIFGRGAGGGLVNRTLKEADWTELKQVSAQVGSFSDRRIALDYAHGVNQNVAVRLNAFYEQSDTFRDFGHLERYGINPTVTFRIGEDTKVKLSYEHFHDERFADRGNPSQSNTNQAITAANAAAMRANPQLPFVSNWATCFCSPGNNGTYVNLDSVQGVVEHDFGNGLTVKNATMYASYLRGYRNIYPGNGPLSGAVNIAGTSMNLAAYENATNRNNLFNQTDFVYRTYTGPIKHTLMFGTEFGYQVGFSNRNTGFFPANGGANTIVVNPFFPTYYGPVVFNHIATDASSRYHLYTESAYVQDQVDITRWLQVIAGARYDRFDLTALDQNTNITRGRVDEKVSPRGAVILKPWDNVSIYGSYSVSYLPASGDQFSTLTDGTLILEPQKFENKEVGAKWNINPRLIWSAAVYELIRTNVPIADPNRPGFSFPSGSHKIQGFETSLTGYVTPEWQSQLGYAYTDARITSATSPTIVPGNIVQLVPTHQFAWWNKYQFTSMWSAALGVIYFSDSFASSDNSVKLPAFWRVDAGVYARINETWKAQVTVENIFDKGYWASADGNNNLSPGAPRTVRLGATANF